MLKVNYAFGTGQGIILSFLLGIKQNISEMDNRRI